MFEHFGPRHIPALVAASTMTFGGLWSLFDPHGAMLEHGLPESVASCPHAAVVLRLNNAIELGLSMYALYFTHQFLACDAMLVAVGVYAATVDSWFVWRRGDARKAALRSVTSGLIAAAGLARWTSGGARL